MLRGLIVRLFALCLFGAATAAADQTPNCTTPAPHDGRAESAAVTFSVLGIDGTPAGKDTVWQPLGGTVGFSLKGNGLADKPPIVCFAYHGGAFQPSPRVWLQSNDTAANTLVYNATVPSKLAGPPQHLGKFFIAARTGIVALSAKIRVIVPDGTGTALTDVTEPIGITSATVSAILALIAMVLAFAFVFGVARSLNVPGTGLLKVISTRGGVASLSQLQVILWTFVIGTGAVYVVAISGGLIDISSGALILLGISGVATVGSKVQNAQSSSTQSTSGALSVQQRPGQVVGLRSVGDRDETEVSLAWSEPASGGRARAYPVQYRRGPAPTPPTPEPWLTVGETVTAPRYRVINLEPDMLYGFRVTAINEYGDAETPSDAITETTRARPAAGPPAQVAGLRLGRPPQLGRIDLVWAPSAGATSYQVQRRPHNTDDAWTDCDPPPGEPKIAVTSGIDSARRYDFRVAARDADRTGPWSSVLTVQAQRQPLWADLVIKPEGANEIDVTRLQMLFFTVVTAVFVAIKIVYSYTIPDIPQGFLVLMGISNGIYLTAKFVPER
jgi:Fibronectin type III domain